MAKPNKQTLYALAGETNTHTVTTVDSDGTAQAIQQGYIQTGAI
jgi:hypothetical protein